MSKRLLERNIDLGRDDVFKVDVRTSSTLILISIK
jgi:hypothetical protein